MCTMKKKKEENQKTNKKSKPTSSSKGGKVSIGTHLQKIEQREMIGIQGIADPRRRKFASGYMDPESKTYGNAKQSMLAAGFSEDYACNVTALKPRWFTDIICQDDIVSMAMANLKEDVSMSIFTKRRVGKTIIESFDKDAGKHRREMTQFALRNLHKKFTQSGNDTGEVQQGVFKGAVVKNFIINYQKPAEVETTATEQSFQGSEGEIIDVESVDIGIDIDEILNN